MSFENHQNLRFLLQAFRKDNQDTRVVVLVDGDSEGRKLKEKVAPLCERLQVPVYSLVENTSIEDYCFYKENFVAAVIRTLEIAFEAEGSEAPSTLVDAVKQDWEEHSKEPKGTTGWWFKELCKKLLKDEASKVGLARNYVELCREAEKSKPDQTALMRARSICREIAKALDLPPLRARQEIIR